MKTIGSRNLRDDKSNARCDAGAFEQAGNVLLPTQQSQGLVEVFQSSNFASVYGSKSPGA
jgi:hypothetical protein